MPSPRTPARRLVRSVVDTPAVNHPLTSALRSLGSRWPAVARWGEHRTYRVGTSDVPMASGGPLLLDGFGRPDWLTHHAFWHGLDDYEPEVLPLFRRACRGATCIVDAGANIGVFAVLAARENPSATVYAFEPATDVFQALAANAVHNDAARLVCVRAALGARTGTTSLFTPAGKIDTVGSSGIEHRVRWTPGPWRCEVVPVVALDDFVAEHRVEHVDVVKIDVEGGEQAVLEGARSTLARFRPDVFLEVLDTDAGRAAAAEVDRHLLPLGYRPFVLTADGPVARDRVEPGQDWNHLLTVRGRRLLAARTS